MAGTTVKVDELTYAKLKEAVAETGKTMIEVLAQAVESYRRRMFLEGLNADFAALRNNRAAWEEELAERTAWDATIADDLQGD
jgi:hypothetical protein